MGGTRSARGANITRIDSADYEDRLNDIGTSKYYDWLLPYEDDLEKEAAYGHRLWVSEDPDVDPWERLYAAVIAMACSDYLDYYIRGNQLMMQVMEDWFSEDELQRMVFDELNHLLRIAPEWDRYNFVKRQLKLIL